MWKSFDANWMSLRLKKRNHDSLYDQINIYMNHSEQEKSAERDHSESAVSC
jgi:hypothetical protein